MMDKQVTESNEKKELRTRIVKQANAMFHAHGIKEVKMDDIAASLSISKRTLYELFENKEELLFEGIRQGHAESIVKAKDIIRQSNGTLEVLLSLYFFYINQIKTINKNYFRELKKYPKVVEERRKGSRKDEQRVRAWLESGVKEGIFREDTNFEILLYIIKENVEFITTTTLFDDYTIEQMGNTFILAYLRGISTPKGLETIETYIRKTYK